MTTLTLPGVTDAHNPSPATIAEAFRRHLHAPVTTHSDPRGTRLEIIAHRDQVRIIAALYLDPIGAVWEVCT